MDDILRGVTWFKHSSVRIRRGGTEIFVDPSGIGEDGEADYVLLTHPHDENFSEQDIARIRGQDTVVIAPASMKRQLHEPDHLLRPGDLLQLQNVDVLAVPAYNRTRTFHPPDSGWLGYVFTVGAVDYYHAGHTDYLESMDQIQCDVALLPCDGRQTMGPADAARVAEACGAQVVVPIHWSDAMEGREVAEIISRQFRGRVVILERTSDSSGESSHTPPR